MMGLGNAGDSSREKPTWPWVIRNGKKRKEKRDLMPWMERYLNQMLPDDGKRSEESFNGRAGHQQKTPRKR